MGIFKSPKAPDPAATAAAQSAQNRDAAVATQLTNAVDQYTPDGNTTWAQDGNWSYVGADGNTVNIPKLKSVQTLNPLQQEAKTYEQQADRDTNKLATTLLGNAQGMLGTPTDYSESAIRARTDAMINPRLEQRFTRDRSALETALAQRGIKQGSQAYSAALGDFEKGRTDTLSQEALSNRQQAITEQGMGQRDAVNMIGALLGTGQIANPQFVQTPKANVAAPDYAGMVYQNYQNKVAQQNAMMGGLFGLGGSIIGAAGNVAKASDIRVKRDIRRIGALPNGLPVYNFRYLWSDELQTGVMAQDVEKIMPEAVTEINGIKHVYYDMILGGY